MAEHFRGTVHREVLTYPVWGYPLVLWLLPRYSWIVPVQVILGAAAMTWAYTRLNVELPDHRQTIGLAFVAAVPWFALQSVKWPLSFAGSFLLLALLTLDHGLRKSRIAVACLSGGLIGAVLYFRSEFLLIPVFLLLFYSLARRRSPQRKQLVLFGAASLAALLSLVPWAVHYKRQAGHYSLTASQKGIVAFISLGQLPGNPWGAEYKDEYAHEYLVKTGVRSIMNSDASDRVLFEEYKRRVSQHPGAFARKVLWNGVLILSKGFYNPEPRLSRRSNAAYEALRNAFRNADLAEIRNPAPVTAWLAFIYWIGAKVLGVGFFLLSILGLFIWGSRGRSSSHLLTLFAGVIVYQVVLQMLLAAEPRYLNGLYLCTVPFFAITVSAVGRWSRNFRQRGG